MSLLFFLSLSCSCPYGTLRTDDFEDSDVEDTTLRTLASKLPHNICPQSRLSSKSPVLKVVCPQSRLSSKLSVLKVVSSTSCALRRPSSTSSVLNVVCPHCPIVVLADQIFCLVSQPNLVGMNIIFVIISCRKCHIGKIPCTFRLWEFSYQIFLSLHVFCNFLLTDFPAVHPVHVVHMIQDFARFLLCINCHLTNNGFFIELS